MARATEEHKELSSYIKTVHSSLRKKAKRLGYDLAWKEHCKDDNNLRKYAKSMKTLATKHWCDNQKSSAKVISRIMWVHNFCQLYFFGDELKRQRNREYDILNKIENIKKESPELIDNYKCLELLDVGSCYNPFKEYNFFQVLAIDIAPACEDVYKCDFINVPLGEHINLDNNLVHQLCINSYNVVVFSLLLEYLPAPEQRLLCCTKAYNLLKIEGILIIITPDSKHVGANAKIMKSWRYVLAKIGFSRIKYEKLPYLHCMVFRKSMYKDVAIRWATLNEERDLYNKLYIPQDFHEINEVDSTKIKENVTNSFTSELAFSTV